MMIGLTTQVDVQGQNTHSVDDVMVGRALLVPRKIRVLPLGLGDLRPGLRGGLQTGHVVARTL